MKIKLCLILPVVGLLAGCETLQTPQQRQQATARQQAASRMATESQQRLQGRVESIEMENARLAQEMQQIQKMFANPEGCREEVTWRICRLKALMKEKMYYA